MAFYGSQRVCLSADWLEGLGWMVFYGSHKVCVSADWMEGHSTLMWSPMQSQSLLRKLFGSALMWEKNPPFFRGVNKSYHKAWHTHKVVLEFKKNFF